MNGELKNPAAAWPFPGRHQPVQGRMSAPCPFGTSRFEIQADGRQVAVVNNSDDARRLWACWNAFLEIPTAEIELAAQTDITSARAGNLFSTWIMLRAQREELLAAAQQAEIWIAQQMLENGWPPERVGDPPAGSHLFNLRTAIAKVKGGAA